MEIKHTIHTIQKLVSFCLCLLFILVLSCGDLAAQPPHKLYTIKNGKMFITLAKQMNEASLDSFITQYALRDLALKEFIRSGFRDSLVKFGWLIEMDNQVGFIISKPLPGNNNININNPSDRITYTEKNPTLAEIFPAVHNRVIYGYNRFRNKPSFAVKDSVVTFYLRNNTNAKQVKLAGSFNDWSPDALAMTPTDSGWIAQVKLGPGKYWYKFIIDGRWTTDYDNRLNENDGLGNVNSVFYKTNFLFTLNSYSNARKVWVSGSFNGWDPDDLQMSKTQSGWELPLYLANGTHRYRFVADGKWFEDPANPDRLPNEFGEFNSVIRLGKFYVFKLDGYLNATRVALAGSFNGWRKDELFMNKTAGGWLLNYALGPGNYEYRILADDQWIGERNEPLIIDPNYTFRLKGSGNAKTVFLAGEFNNWSPDAYPMKREGDEWVFSVNLSPGKHLYKFVVDGKWIIDPDNKLWEQNEFDTGNSVIWTGK